MSPTPVEESVLPSTKEDFMYGMDLGRQVGMIMT